MVKVIAILVLLLSVGCVNNVRMSVERTVEPLRFIQPKARISMAPLTGVDIPVQLWVEPHEDNRRLDVVWRGVGCAGSSFRQLDAQHEAAVQPPMGAIKIRMTPGLCTIVAEIRGPGGVPRHRAVFEMRICGGPENCLPEVE